MPSERASAIFLPPTLDQCNFSSNSRVDYFSILFRSHRVLHFRRTFSPNHPKRKTHFYCLHFAHIKKYFTKMLKLCLTCFILSLLSIEVLKFQLSVVSVSDCCILDYC